MDSIIDLIDDIQDLLESSKKSAFSANKITVDKQEIIEILEDMRYNLPSELAQAKRISEKCEKIVQEAHNKGNLIIKQAEDQAEKLVLEHEITKQAKEQADIIVEDARKDARELRSNAVAYADALLGDVEEAVSNTLRKIEDDSRDVIAQLNDSFGLITDDLNAELELILKNRNELKTS